MELVRRRHSVTSLQARIIFTPKYRRRVFTGEHMANLREAFAAACEKMECELISFDGDADHVHLLIRYPPTLSMSSIVNVLKSASSKRLRGLHPELKRLGKTSAIWSRSYFACSVGGAPLEVLRHYIENQNTPE